MMDLDSAIQHCKEQVQEQAKKGCYSCAEEHQQLAEWLKELKACREERRMKLLIDIPEHIYEHAKETTEDSRDEFDAMRAIANGTQQESGSENPNTCGDCISREAVEKITWSEPTYTDALNVLAEVRDKVRALPSVTPQQRTGRWIPVSERLPEDRTYVLTTIKVPNRIAHARSGWYDGGFFHNDNGDTWKATDREVIAWMPLPEPYKAESEDKE